MSAAPPTEPPRCTFVKANGSRCQVTFALRDGLCAPHDPARAERMRAARHRGGASSAARGRTNKTVRVVSVDAVPPLATLDDAVTASAWLFKLGVSGQLDPATAREGNRSVTTFKDSIHKRDLLARIRELERKLKQYEQERTA